MKKQQKTYILLAISCIVWGIIGVQIYGYLNPESEKQELTQYQKFTPEKTQEKEIYVVNTHDRDPFLDRYKQTKLKKRSTKKTKKKHTKTRFPKIIYNGIVINKKSKSFIVTVKNQQQIMKIGDVFNDIKLISGNSKEIKVKHQDEVNIITK